jgi:hypothetical protein
MEESTQPIILQLSLEEVNLILKSLGGLPFRDVYDLIGKINEQATRQLNAEGK